MIWVKYAFDNKDPFFDVQDSKCRRFDLIIFQFPGIMYAIFTWKYIPEDSVLHSN